MHRFVALSIANANVALTHPVTSLSGFSHFNANYHNQLVMVTITDTETESDIHNLQ